MMRFIIILVFIYFSSVAFGQNFQVRIGGNFNISNTYVDDLIAPFNDNVTQAELISGEYDHLFQTEKINSIFNHYRSSSPRIGGSIHLIGLLRLKPNLFLRIGTDLQMIRLKRIIDRQVVLYENYDNYKTTARFTDLHFEIPLTAFYLSLPFNIQYDFKKQGFSVFGGVIFSTRLFDRNADGREGGIDLGNNEYIYINPFMDQFFSSINLGFSYQIRNKINLDFYAVKGLSNLYDGVNRATQKSFLQQITVGASYKLF